MANQLRKFWLCILSPVAFFILTVTVSNAAQITEIKNHPMGCVYMLDGIIETGDVEKISNLFGRENNNVTLGLKFCLNSPGGAYLEGVRLAALFANTYSSTVVAQNAVCESACAIAFLGGKVELTGGTDFDPPNASRIIHATAKLGFHAPVLLIPEGDYTEKAVQKAYSVAMEAVVELSNLRESGVIIPDTLLRKILSTPFDDMHYADTVRKTIEYNIDVEGIGKPTGRVQVTADNVCKNVSFKDLGLEGYSQNPSVFMMKTKPNQYDARTDTFSRTDTFLESDQNYLTEGAASCQVMPAGEGFIVSFLGTYDDEKTYWASNVLSFKLNDALVSLHTRKTYTNSEFDARMRMEYRYESMVKYNCSIENRIASITNVQNFTNLRRQAGLNGQVIGQVPLGAKVSVLNPGKFLRYDRCAAACDGTNQNAIKQCIDNNDVWIEVKHNGRSGFLSRKFIK